MTVEERKILEEYLELQEHVLTIEYKDSVNDVFKNTILCRDRGLDVLTKILNKEKDKLIPCPWCRKKPIVVKDDHRNYYVQCDNLYCNVNISTNGFVYEQEAIDAWNEGLE